MRKDIKLERRGGGSPDNGEKIVEDIGEEMEKRRLGFD